jgi:hypothetical protein
VAKPAAAIAAKADEALGMPAATMSSACFCICLKLVDSSILHMHWCIFHRCASRENTNSAKP